MWCGGYVVGGGGYVLGFYGVGYFQFQRLGSYWKRVS